MSKAPLVPVLLPERAGIDLVDPLEPSVRGPRFILVLVDYAAGYPKVVAIWLAPAQTMASEQLQIFSWVGILRGSLNLLGHCLYVQAFTRSLGPVESTSGKDFCVPSPNRWPG